MAQRIVWSHRARNDRMKILQYWQKRNKSKVYSKKLFKLFQVSVRQIGENPTIGKPTSINEIRSYVLKDYMIFYEILNDHILILTIWDSRQNPTKLSL
ncbi:type II toxin-antitoxin system RelE/ParE family toxin [Salinimicrobium sp. CDJ15-81-2]|nr:type II toxin-antitoxin system RelE/ParE family toxin [Salinimicrobium nanhaiense]